MAINPEYVGRTFEPSEPYEVSRVKIAEFATAIGEPSPLCRESAAAQAAGVPGRDRATHVRDRDHLGG